MSAKLDESKYSEDSANPLEVLFAKAIPVYNKMTELSEAYAALSDTDDAVAEVLSNATDPEILKALEKRKQLTAAIEKINAQLKDYALAKVTESLGSGLTPEQIKKDHQDLGAKLSELTLNFRPMFELMGFIKKGETPEGKKRAVYVSTGTEQGDIFAKLLNKPNLGNSAPTGEGKKVREWWQNNPLADFPYQKQGKIPAGVWEAYRKANPSESAE